jgi:hypothetical protein
LCISTPKEKIEQGNTSSKPHQRIEQHFIFIIKKKARTTCIKKTHTQQKVEKTEWQSKCVGVGWGGCGGGLFFAFEDLMNQGK